MNLFRSEEDARRWAEFVPGSEAGIVTLEQAMAIMSTPRHRKPIRRPVRLVVAELRRSVLCEAARRDRRQSLVGAAGHLTARRVTAAARMKTAGRSSFPA